MVAMDFVNGLFSRMTSELRYWMYLNHLDQFGQTWRKKLGLGPHYLLTQKLKSPFWSVRRLQRRPNTRLCAEAATIVCPNWEQSVCFKRSLCAFPCSFRTESDWRSELKVCMLSPHHRFARLFLDFCVQCAKWPLIFNLARFASPGH